MMKMKTKTKIKRNDTVTVLKGRDKGKTGRVLHVYYKTGKALVEGINFHKKASRPNKNNPQGGIINVEKPITLPNIEIFCQKCKAGTKASKRLLADGKKERFCKKCGETF